MKPMIRALTVMLVLITFCPPAVAGERDLVAALVPGDIKGARLNLNSWGPHLGFESEIDGDDPRMVALVSVIRNAEPAQGHKCANRGAIRFLMAGGGVIAVGLLPSHSEGFLISACTTATAWRVSTASNKSRFSPPSPSSVCPWTTRHFTTESNRKPVR